MVNMEALRSEITQHKQENHQLNTRNKDLKERRNTKTPGYVFGAQIMMEPQYMEPHFFAYIEDEMWFPLYSIYNLNMWFLLIPPNRQ